MINTAAKFEFGLAAFCFALAIAAAASNSNPGAFAMLFGVTCCITLLAVATAASGFADQAARFPSQAEAPAVQMVVVGPARAPRPSAWPLAAAVAVGLVALGFAIGYAYVLIGLVIGFLAAAGWVSQAWREDPSFTPSEGVRISGRLLTPVGLPLMALALIAVVVISVSRVLLSLPRFGSIATAFGLALALLVVFFALASRPDLRRNRLVAFAGVTLDALILAASVSAAHGYRTFDVKPPPGPDVEVAHNTAFEQKTLSVTQGQLTRIEFINQDKGIYHNVAVYGSNGTTPIWAGEPVEGAKKIVYLQTFYLPPGKYVFRCNFHPTAMVGTFVVKPASTTSTTGAP